MNIHLTDPTSHRIGGEIQNLGDIIIKDAIQKHLRVSGEYRWIGIDGLEGNRRPHAGLLILAGANILANNPFTNASVWRPPLPDYLRAQYVVLFGIGWWQYQSGVSAATRFFYRRVLVREHVLHSVRDAYTAAMLKRCGIQNVLNTGCPTMWDLPPYFRFERRVPPTAVFTLTDYYKDPASDRLVLELLLKKYPALYFFPQGTGDIDYLRTLAGGNLPGRVQVLDRSIDAFNNLLHDRDVDYVGTRLHAGIRALQKNRRTFIVSVDNRATEISKDTGLCVIPRGDVAGLEHRIDSDFEFELRIDRNAVALFKQSLEEYTAIVSSRAYA